MVAAVAAPPSSSVQELEARLAALEKNAPRDAVSIVCFGGEWDRLFAAFAIANGALAMGQEVDMFFTFWGATAVRNGKPAADPNRSWAQRLFAWMLPKSVAGAPLSRLNFGGLSKTILAGLMRKHQILDLSASIAQARELGARFHYCDTSLKLFGWNCSDLLDASQDEAFGVASFLNLARTSRVTLFI